jgi:cytochrome c-type biogenesis protein CcmF
MLPEVGLIAVGLALAAALYAAFAAYWSTRRSDRPWLESARNGVYASVGLLGLALLSLLVAFLRNQFQIEYVALHSSRDLPLYLKVSAVWAGQEGSLLLWAFLQALFAALAVRRPSQRSRPLIPWATVFLSIVTAFFVAVTFFLSNPFDRLPTPPADGLGMNPVLRHPGMAFHPPALYLGYVGLAVPFAFALAALVTGRVDDWPAGARRWTLGAWLFLGLGLLLGARWAYDVLGWGGYWGWDPVENAGLMPWLTSTALLHGIVMQQERKGFRVWNVLLAVLSFVLVLLGTFITRSGLIQSVHAYARSNLGAYFLAFIFLSLGVSLVLLVLRIIPRSARVKSWLRSNPRSSGARVGAAILRAVLVDPQWSILDDAATSSGLLSRDGTFFLTVLLMLLITLTVLVGSLLPTLSEVLTGQRFEASSEWFDRTTGPQFAALVLLMGVCPLLGRAVGALRRLGTRGWPALLGAVLVVAVAALAGFTDWVSLLGFGIIGLAGATALAETIRDVVTRVGRRGEGPLQAMWRMFGRNRRKYGGYLVHTGVILMAIGIVGTRMVPFETEEVLISGDVVEVGTYTLVFEELRQEPGTDYFSTVATLSVYQDGAYLTTLRPRVESYVNFDQPVGVPALRSGLREDLYLILAGWSMGEDMATFKVFINPLASFLWLGGLVFLAGGTVAVWPARPARLSVPHARRRAIASAAGLAVGLLLLALAVWAMWGTGQGTAASLGAADPPAAARSMGRVRPGQPAPDFALELLDGSSLALGDLQGQVVVINFWATWCPPCEDELPDLQAVWEEVRERGAVFVGIAFEEDEADVREMTSEFGITYPLGLDVGDRISIAYGITGVPETFVIDAAGNVAGVHVGPITAQELRAELDGLLGQ